MVLKQKQIAKTYVVPELVFGAQLSKTRQDLCSDRMTSCLGSP